MEEEDDVHCPAQSTMATESQFKTLISTSAQSRAPDADDVPPPIPPRSESLASPGVDYDQPLPAVPARMKRTHPEMEQQTATATATGSESSDADAADENPEEESDSTRANEEAADSGSELEPKRRKGDEAPVEETIPRFL